MTTLPLMDPITRIGLVKYKELLADLPYTSTVSGLVSCIDHILEHVDEARP